MGSGKLARSLPQVDGWGGTSISKASYLHMIAQHELLGVWVQVDLLVHPVGNQVAIGVMLESVQNYFRGTIGITMFSSQA